VKGDDLDLSVPIFYIHGNKWAGRRYFRTLVTHWDAFTLVCLPANRIEKFKRDVPQVKEGGAALREKQNEWVASLKDDVRLALYMKQQYLDTAYANLDESKVDDPELQSLIRTAKVKVGKAASKAASFGWSVPRPDGWVDLLKVGYPLTDCAHRLKAAQKDHVYMYINAVYAAQQAKEDS
jgi:hypothetical protein